MASAFLSLIPGLLSNPTIGGLVNRGISAVSKFLGFGGNDDVGYPTIGQMSQTPRTVGSLGGYQKSSGFNFNDIIKYGQQMYDVYQQFKQGQQNEYQNSFYGQQFQQPFNQQYSQGGSMFQNGLENIKRNKFMNKQPRFESQFANSVLGKRRFNQIIEEEEPQFYNPPPMQKQRPDILQDLQFRQPLQQQYQIPQQKNLFERNDEYDYDLELD